MGRFDLLHRGIRLEIIELLVKLLLELVDGVADLLCVLSDGKKNIIQPCSS